MVTDSLIISFSAAPADSQADAPWLNMEQEEIPDAKQSANLNDIKSMWDMAITGLSAHAYQPERCPVTIADGIVTVHLGFYVYLYRQDMQYDIEASFGVIGPVEIRPVTKEFDLVFGLTDCVSLDFCPDPNPELIWQTDAWSALGARISRPVLTVENNTISAEVSFFGVLRCKCTTQAHYYPIDISVAKAGELHDPEPDATCVSNCETLFGPESLNPDGSDYIACMKDCQDTANLNAQPLRDGYNVTNLRSTILASWMGLEKLEQESLTLEIPQCVADLLTLCADGTPANWMLHQSGSGDHPTLYYNSCTGQSMGVRYG